MIVRVKDANWPFFSYNINFCSQFYFIRKLTLPCFKGSGYGVSLGGRSVFVALFILDNKIFFSINEKIYDVGDDRWKGKISFVDQKNRIFYLLKDEKIIDEVMFVDRNKEKSISPEAHFLFDVVDWLSSKEMKYNFRKYIG